MAKQRKRGKGLKPVKNDEFRSIGKVCFCFVGQDRITFHFMTNKIYELPFIRQSIIIGKTH
jgi:hypothetical protein